MSGTEITPKIPGFDKEVLSDILNYSSSNIQRISIDEFKRKWADRLFSNPEEDKSELLKEWEYTVSLGKQVPVYIQTTEGKDHWVFPPLLGDFKTRFTATPQSLGAMHSEVTLLRQRLTSQGEAAEEQMLQGVAPVSSDRTFFDVHLFMLRRECGYLTSDEEKIFQKIVNKVAIESTSSRVDDNSDDEEDYDY